MSIGEPWRREDGQWMIPGRVEGDNVEGFKWVELTPAHPMYDEWMAYIRTMWAHDLSGTVAPPS